MMVTRTVCKYLIQNCSDEVVVQLLDTPTATPPPSPGTEATATLEPRSLTTKGTGTYIVSSSNGLDVPSVSLYTSFCY